MQTTKFLRISVITLSLFLFLSLAILGRIDPSASAVDTNVSIEIPDNLNLSVDNGSGSSDVHMQASAATMGSLLKSGVTVTASTNNKTGYTLTFSDKDNDNALVDVNNSALTIPSISTTTAEANMPESKWGMSINGADFEPIPLLSAPLEIDVTSTPGENTYTVDFASKVSYSTPGGLYQDGTVFTLTANGAQPSAPLTLADVNGRYIQDVDMATVCANTPTPDAFQTDGTTINGSVPATTLIDRRDENPYPIAKLADGNCWMQTNLYLGSQYRTYKLTSENSDVADEYTLPISTTTNWVSNTVVDAINVRGRGYGNFYSWKAVTAGTGAISGNQPTQYSICPKGMKLPASFSGLFSKYKLTSYRDLDKITRAPLIMPKGGQYNPAYTTGNLQDVGSKGYYWTTYSQRNLFFHDNGITHESQFAMYAGYSARCMTSGGS